MVICKMLNVAAHLHVIQRQFEANEGHDPAYKPRPESGTVEFMSDPICSTSLYSHNNHPTIPYAFLSNDIFYEREPRG
jgi:hypothetical protein